VSWAVDGWILVEAESSFEAELDSVEQNVACLIEHGFSFLNYDWEVPFEW
jgi:hypothetical protein